MRRGSGDPSVFDQAIDRGREWVVGLQSRDGGWAAFDADNTHQYLNNIPFADHGALLDPPTADVTARCLSMLAQLGETSDERARRSPRRSITCAATSEPDGSWYGRWGMNYIYGTWSVLCALNAAGMDRLRAGDPQGSRLACCRSRTRTAAGAKTVQATSSTIAATSARPSTASQTAWALLGLMAAGEVEPSGRRARHRLPAAHAGRGRHLAGDALYRDRLPARLLPALSWLCEVLSAVGAGALPQHEDRQHATVLRYGM